MKDRRTFRPMLMIISYPGGRISIKNLKELLFSLLQINPEPMGRNSSEINMSR